MVELKRKIYKRGSSYETTIPLPILFSLDLDKKQNAIFKLDPETNRWYLEFEEQKEQPKKKVSKKRKKKK